MGAACFTAANSMSWEAGLAVQQLEGGILMHFTHKTGKSTGESNKSQQP